jgi:surface antigen
MKGSLAAVVLALTASAAHAQVPAELAPRGTPAPLAPHLQCVPFAREVTGIQIYGDAFTWWSQAEGRYARGNAPRAGAVMAFRPHGSMKLGHVAAVSRVLDSRTVLLTHANWSPIEGRRGQIERDVRAVDVSQLNDWSEVRVWYGPINDLGTTVYPVEGFIYQERSAPALAPLPPAQPPRDVIAEIIRAAG